MQPPRGGWAQEQQAELPRAATREAPPIPAESLALAARFPHFQSLASLKARGMRTRVDYLTQFGGAAAPRADGSDGAAATGATGGGASSGGAYSGGLHAPPAEHHARKRKPKAKAGGAAAGATGWRHRDGQKVY